MKAPKELTGEALAFWKRHAKPLEDAGILTERDRESFTLLCKLWSMLQCVDLSVSEENYRTMGQYINLVKQYQSLAKQFGLLPRERKSANMEMNTNELDEFGIGG